jgi:membrane-associated protease RseP (regulator of RpoE activity)
MDLFLLLNVLIVLTYFMLKRSVTRVTRTPVWLLWLVTIAPALIWTGWLLYAGNEKPIPTLLVIAPLVVCPLLFWWLIQIGQTKTEVKSESTNPIAENNNTSNGEQKNSKVRPISNNEEIALRNCFPWQIYFLQKIDYFPQAILCRGKLRAVPEEAYQTIKSNVEDVFKDRFLVIFQESFEGQPFFALVPNPQARSLKNKPTEEPLTRPSFALFLLLLTLLTTTAIGVEISGYALDQLESNPKLLLRGLPYSLGLLSILGIHELSHYLSAIFYKIRTTLPYFIPVPFFLGTFGAFIQMRSPVPNRKALFDVGIAGPLGGLVVTIPLLLWGLSLSEVVPVSDQSNILNFDSLDPRFSFLLAILAKLTLGSQLTAQTTLDLHPLAVAGYLGLWVTALNLMPVGQLDGGHIVHAMLGQRAAAIIGQITRLLMLVFALVRPDFLLWAIILLFMPVIDQPALNDVTELDNWRDFLGIFALVVLVVILLPLPGSIANLLSI